MTGPRKKHGRFLKVELPPWKAPERGSRWVSLEDAEGDAWVRARQRAGERGEGKIWRKGEGREEEGREGEGWEGKGNNVKGREGQGKAGKG